MTPATLAGPHCKRLYLVFIEYDTRRIYSAEALHIPPASGQAAGPQIGLTLDERFEDIRFLIRDLGSNFTASFDAGFPGHRPSQDPAQRGPGAAHERGSANNSSPPLRRDLLDRVLIIGKV